MTITASPTEPGVYYGLDNDVYQRIDALSATGLKRLARSPHHFYSLTLDPARPVSEPTPAMRAGTLAHCMILEPDKVSERYVVVPTDAPRRPSSVQRNAKKPSAETLAAVDWWDAFGIAHAGKEVVDDIQMLTAKRQAAAIRELPEIAALLANGRAETSVLWIDKESGVLCKCRPDWKSVADAGLVLVDIKTTQSAASKDFARSAFNFSYAMQNVHYCEGVEVAAGLCVLGFCFAITESEYPHAARAFMLSDEWLDAARRKRRRLIELYAKCRSENAWPGYSKTLEVLDKPQWLGEDEA